MAFYRFNSFYLIIFSIFRTSLKITLVNSLLVKNYYYYYCYYYYSIIIMIIINKQVANRLFIMINVILLLSILFLEGH